MLLTIPTALIEKHAVKQSPSRIEELVKIFVHATKVGVATIATLWLRHLQKERLIPAQMETGFWNMASTSS